MQKADVPWLSWSKLSKSCGNTSLPTPPILFLFFASTSKLDRLAVFQKRRF